MFYTRTPDFTLAKLKRHHHTYLNRELYWPQMLSILRFYLKLVGSFISGQVRFHSEAKKVQCYKL